RRIIRCGSAADRRLDVIVAPRPLCGDIGGRPDAPAPAEGSPPAPLRMLTLHLLGGVSLAEDSGPVSGAATQRRRLALLARIAAAPGATLSRDRLIGCFWAEEDRERA